jgi:hypothetical protein
MNALIVYISLYLIACAISIPKFLTRLHYSKDEVDGTYDVSYVNQFIFHIHILVLYMVVIFEVTKFIAKDLFTNVKLESIKTSIYSDDFMNTINVLMYLFITTVPINIFSFHTLSTFYDPINTMKKARYFTISWTAFSFASLVFMLVFSYTYSTENSYAEFELSYPENFIPFIIAYIAILYVFYVNYKLDNQTKPNVEIKTETGKYKELTKRRINFFIRTCVIFMVSFQLQLT